MIRGLLYSLADRREPSIRVLLVEPAYYTRYPSLGLLKLASLHTANGDQVLFQRGLSLADETPNVILITSLFTYAWRPVHETVEYYRALYPQARIRLGGTYATLMPEHAQLAGADEIARGLVPEAEPLRPDYSLVPDWGSSIIFASRGCIRKCAFCAVPRLEGKTWGPARSIRDLVQPAHKKVVLWDNNILGVANWRDVVAELAELDVEIDFNQGLDARLITSDVALELSRLRVRPVRMAYDMPGEKRALEQAIPMLEAAGFRRRAMHVYTLYNFVDTPEEFLGRVVDLLSWGVVCYPMRYEPLNSLTKNRYVSPHWNAKQLEMVAQARRVLGYGGAFPPYRPLLDKFRNAASFEEAFVLREGPNGRDFREGVAGLIEEPTDGLNDARSGFRELLNDPMTLSRRVTCEACGQDLASGERAFAVQDYAGRYVAYVCPRCHPNHKWINALWRSVLGEAFSRDGHGSAESPPAALIGRALTRG